MDISSEKAFEEYAVQHGGWGYDNHGNYRGEIWTWYYSAAAPVGTVLMRQPSTRVELVRFEGLAPKELWSGYISTSEEFDQMIRALSASRQGAA